MQRWRGSPRCRWATSPTYGVSSGRRREADPRRHHRQPSGAVRAACSGADRLHQLLWRLVVPGAGLGRRCRRGRGGLVRLAAGLVAAGHRSRGAAGVPAAGRSAGAAHHDGGRRPPDAGDAARSHRRRGRRVEAAHHDGAPRGQRSPVAGRRLRDRPGGRGARCPTRARCAPRRGPSGCAGGRPGGRHLGRHPLPGLGGAAGCGLRCYRDRLDLLAFPARRPGPAAIEPRAGGSPHRGGSGDARSGRGGGRAAGAGAAAGRFPGPASRCGSRHSHRSTPLPMRRHWAACASTRRRCARRRCSR